MNGKGNKAMSNSLSLCTAAALAALSLNAFELGREDSTIYAAKGQRPVAEELSGYLAKVFGRPFPVKAMPEEITQDLAGIFVGVKPPDSDVKWDAEMECSARIVEKSRVWLFGNDSGKLLHGTRDAVYDFLERFAGVRWLWPGEIGTVADPQKSVAMPDEHFVYVPPFRRRLTNSFTYFTYAAGMSPAEKRDLKEWLGHRHVGSSLSSRGSGFQHAFASLMPRSEYGREHPEYYALVPPERWIGEPKPTKPTRLSDPLMAGSWQLCTSNPDVRRIVAEKLIAANTDAIQSISPNDGYGFCECPACRAQDPEGQGIGDGVCNITDRMYDFLCDVAWRVYRASPTSKVGLFSYSIYSDVPTKKFKLPPNVYLSCCYIVYGENKAGIDVLDGKLTGLAELGAQIIGREYWGTHYTMRYPLSHSRKIDHNIKLLHRIGAAGIYGATGNSFAVRASDLYLLTLLAWDPTANREAALRDFCEKAFGRKAAPVMYALFESIEDCVERKIEVFAQNHGKVFGDYPNDYAEFNRYMTTIFDEEFSKMCDRETRKAAKLADTPERRRRVEYIAAGLGFARLTTAALRGFAELAAAGNDMPLTQPSADEIVMEKSALLEVVNRAIAAEDARKSYSRMYHGSNALASDMRSESLSLRPWGTMAERARLLLRSDRYSYLVNGAFEYRCYSWEVSGDGTFDYTTARNHDADDCWMVQCHHGQGVSLELRVAPHGTMKVRNLRKISPTSPSVASMKLFVRCDDDPMTGLKVALGGRELKGFDVSRDVPEGDGWHELRFLPAEIPAGGHELEISVRNDGNEPRVVNIDSLNLRLKASPEK